MNSAPTKGGLSVADDNLDSMVQAASTPTLADLFRRAKERGNIVTATEYGGTAKS